MGRINLQKMSVDAFTTLTQKDKYTIYWLDDGSIYIGTKQYGGGKKTLIQGDLNNFPVPGDTAALYFDITSGNLYYWNDNIQEYRQVFVTKLSHSLTIGDKVYDGSEDIYIDVYDGSLDEALREDVSFPTYSTMSMNIYDEGELAFIFDTPKEVEYCYEIKKEIDENSEEQCYDSSTLLNTKVQSLKMSFHNQQMEQTEKIDSDSIVGETLFCQRDEESHKLNKEE